MQSFDDYLNQRLTDRFTKRHVVVWYDSSKEFEPFVDALMVVELPRSPGTTRVKVGDAVVDLARYDGSFFGLRAAVESLVSADEPEPLLIYMPGVVHDTFGSVLKEMEEAGICYKPQLRQLARSAMRKFTTDGEIDELLGDRKLDFDDVEALFDQHGGGERASMLKVIFGRASSEVMLARWLAEEELDAQIGAKDAQQELYGLVASRLGLELDQGTDLSRARDRASRFVLVGEFRHDLNCDAPASLGSIPAPPSKDHMARTLEVAQSIRTRHADAYVELADRVEAELGLAGEGIDASCLGQVDTFRFEERLLLRRCGGLLRDKKYGEALDLVAQRRRSFWVDRDVERQAQWEVCRLMAELGHCIDEVSPQLSRVGEQPTAWVRAYTAEDGWCRVDLAFRSLQAWETRMPREPEDEVALQQMRQRYDTLARSMAEGFSSALQSGGWTVDGFLAQQEVFPRVVDGGGRTAYFLVDAMRYEMGVELTRRLQNVDDLNLQPAVAALPTITPVGMAALLPGASESFSVVEEGGKLASRIEGVALPQLPARMKFLRSKVPDAVDLTLNRVLEHSGKRLARELGSSPLVVVRSQEVDALGEIVEGWTARQVMDTVIGNVARAAHKLAGLGIERFVVTADHGHLFGSRKEEDMCTDAPGGDTVSAHRRCWVGRGGKTPPGTVRVSGADLGYDTDLEFVFPVGLGVFRAQGGLSFHHGGLSLQELLVPVVSFRISGKPEAAETGVMVELSAVPDQITNRTFGVKITVMPKDLFTQDPVPLRVVGLSDKGDQVARAGMVMDADFDATSGIVRVAPKATATVGLLLTRDEGYKTVEIVVQNAETDAELARSAALKLNLGI